MTKLWIPRHVDLKIAAQIKNSGKAHGDAKTAPFITISRAFGCDGMALAESIIRKLNKKDPGWFIFRRRMLSSEDGVELTEERISQLEQFGHSEIHSYIREALFGMPNQLETVKKLARISYLLAKSGKVVFLGGGAAMLTQSLENGVHLRINATVDWRVKNHKRRLVENNEASGIDVYKLVQSRSKDRESFIKTYLGQDVSSYEHYDLILNNERVSVDLASELVTSLLRLRGLI